MNDLRLRVRVYHYQHLIVFTFHARIVVGLDSQCFSFVDARDPFPSHVSPEIGPWWSRILV